LREKIVELFWHLAKISTTRDTIRMIQARKRLRTLRDPHEKEGMKGQARFVLTSEKQENIPFH